MGRTICCSIVFGIASNTFAAAFNDSAAQVYADTYVLTPNHADYRTFDADCTNFVSQCLYAGGLTMSDDWYYNRVASGAFDNWSATWSFADDLEWYLKEIQHATLLGRWAHTDTYVGSTRYYKWVNNSNNLTGMADIIFYDWNSDGQVDHASICVGTGRPYLQDNSGPSSNAISDVVDAHSAARKHQQWHLSNYNGQYKTTKIYAYGI